MRAPRQRVPLAKRSIHQRVRFFVRYEITSRARRQLIHNGVLNQDQRNILSKDLGFCVSVSAAEIVGMSVSKNAYKDALAARCKPNKKQRLSKKRAARNAARAAARKAIAEQVEQNLAAMGLAVGGKPLSKPSAKPKRRRRAFKAARTKEADIEAALYNRRDKLSPSERQEFRASLQWKQLRYEALKRSRGCCDCCGARAALGRPLHVDHIKPMAAGGAPSSLDNLQVLCQDCNEGKGSWDDTDWRPASVVRESFTVDIDGLSEVEKEHMRSILH